METPWEHRCAVFSAETVGKEGGCCCRRRSSGQAEILNDYCEFCSPEVLSKEEFECAVAIDVADIPRLGRLKDAFLASEHTLVIDHHPTNTEFGEYNLIDCKASTGEVVMEIIDSMGAEN